MYLLDTNHCSFIIKQEPSVIQRLNELDIKQVTTCVITQGELVYMAENSERRESNRIRVEAFLQTVHIFEVDTETSKIYGRLKAELMNQFAPRERSQRRRTRITDIGFDDNDLWVAAIALQHNLIIVSVDSDFQRLQAVRLLSVETWYLPSTES